MSIDQFDDEFLNANLDLNSGLDALSSRKRNHNHTFCISCGDEMKIGPLLVCAECLDEECDKFSVYSSLSESDEIID